MSDFRRLKLARQHAEALVAELGILEPPVDPFLIAKEHGIQVEAKPPDVEGGSGMLLRHGNDFLIVYAKDSRGEGFQRFSIAHELGHYFLPGHCDQLLRAGVHASRAGQGVADPYEQEADAFASGLLLPRALLQPFVRRGDLGLDLLLYLASTFGTSLTATAIRLAELARDPMALIVSHGGTIEICAMSEAFKPHARRGWLRKGDCVPQGSISAILGSDAAWIRAAGRTDSEVDIADWYDCEAATPGREEALGLGAYGRVLTILTCGHTEEDDDDDEDAQEEELIERWTPRFRR